MMYQPTNPFGSLPQFGGNTGFPGGPNPFAGASGFAGDMPGYGFDPSAMGGAMSNPGKKKKHGMFGSMWPMFGLAGLLSHKGGLGDVAPLLGGLAGFGISKL